MAKQNKPAIRFKEFTDAWEQRKLGELVDRVVRKNTNNESTLPLTISAQYGLVDQITYFNNRVASRDVSNYYLVLNGEFAYNKSTSDGYPFGAVKRLDLYEKGVLSTLYIVFVPKKEQQIDSDFLTVFFDTNRWHKGVAERAAEGARNHGLLNISAEDFFDIDLSVPKDVVEQKQIGAFIRQLDDLITLHQRKYDKLQVLKKAMLEKMFPKNGSSVPEIRFKGFTDAWEQRKLGEIVEIKDSARIPNNEWSDIGVPYIRASDISSKNLKGTLFISSERYEFYKNKTGAPMRGDVLFNGGGEIGKSIICNDSKPIYVQGGAVLYARTSASNKLEASYLKTYYETSHSRKYIDAASAGGTMKHFTLKPAQEMPVYLPEAEEQKQIGDFYICIDNLITLHQRELEKLQNIKKSMLEKMFV